MARFSRSLVVLGVLVGALGLLPWNVDFLVRAVALMIGFALIVAAFPGYRFLLASRRFATELEDQDEDDDH